MSADELTSCPCDELSFEAEPWIAAGLDALPRQTRTFSRVRRALLDGLRSTDRAALARWEARGEGDLGVLWLEMWAYVADVLNFYDERIANETYLRTAVRRTSLRRLIELLGYVQAPGVAGSVVLAALAEGRSPVLLPAGTAFRSDAFDEEPPQIFELDEPVWIDPLRNEWRVGPLRKDTFPQVTPTVATQLAGGASRSERTRFLPFESGSLGVGVDSYLSFQIDRDIPMVDRVVGVKPFEGEDSRSYMEVELQNGLNLPQLAPERLSVKTPTSTAGVSSIISAQSRLSLDGLFPRIKPGDTILVTDSRRPDFFAVREVRETVIVSRTLLSPSTSGKATSIEVPVTQLLLDTTISDSAAAQLTVHFDWVRAGVPTVVRSVDIEPSDLRGAGRVQLEGVLDVPAAGREIQGEFLVEGANERGEHVQAGLQIDGARRGHWGVQDPLSSSGPPSFLAPLQIFGNVIHASRGETVTQEVLGSGNPREAFQRFTLRKKPLTYLPAPETAQGIRSTLQVWVDGVRWTEVKSFYGAGPDETIYTVRHDDEQETIIQFGDGRRGARLPSGVENVVASYRFGSGEAAPPAGAVNQISRSVLGLRGVRAPVAARPGRQPDAPETLRTTAPRSLLLLGRAVSVADFEALAQQEIGVVRAVAEYAWLPEEQASGVSVHYVGGAEVGAVLARLRAMAEPTLHIEVRNAQPLIRRLSLSILVAPEHKAELVQKAVREELLRAHGVLSIEAAPVGGRLWVSRIFEAAQRIPGVLAVTGGSVSGERFHQDLSVSDGICVPRGSYLDFVSDGEVLVNVQGPSSQNVRSLRQAGEG